MSVMTHPKCKLSDILDYKEMKTLSKFLYPITGHYVFFFPRLLHIFYLPIVMFCLNPFGWEEKHVLQGIWESVCKTIMVPCYLKLSG